MVRVSVGRSYGDRLSVRAASTVEDGREIWGDMGRYGEIWGDMGRYGEIWGDTVEDGRHHFQVRGDGVANGRQPVHCDGRLPVSRVELRRLVHLVVIPPG